MATGIDIDVRKQKLSACAQFDGHHNRVTCCVVVGIFLKRRRETLLLVASEDTHLSCSKSFKRLCVIFAGVTPIFALPHFLCVMVRLFAALFCISCWPESCESRHVCCPPLTQKRSFHNVFFCQFRRRSHQLRWRPFASFFMPFFLYQCGLPPTYQDGSQLLFSRLPKKIFDRIFR